MSKISIKKGVIHEKISHTKYIVKLDNGEEGIVILSPKLLMNGTVLSKSAKIFFLAHYIDGKLYGNILTESDFKYNGWTGWIDGYEPPIS